MTDQERLDIIRTAMAHIRKALEGAQGGNLGGIPLALTIIDLMENRELKNDPKAE
jgi:orotate phosphoribosyltransferase